MFFEKIGKPRTMKEENDNLRIVIFAAVLAVVAPTLFIIGMNSLSWLYGPHWRLLADAGPLFISRAGSMLIIFFPAFSVVMAFICKIKALVALLLFVVLIPAYGYYLHHIVYWQGLDSSEQFFRAESGFPESEPTPQHITEILTLSYSLAEKGKAPWLPREWKEIEWPEDAF